jgi:hypothetical protein
MRRLKISVWKSMSEKKPTRRSVFQATVDYLDAAGAEAAGAAGAEAAGAEAAALAAEAAALAAEAAAFAAEAALLAAAAASAAGAGAGAAIGAGAGAAASSFLPQAAKATANKDAINSVFFMNISFKDYKNFAMNNYR